LPSRLHAERPLATTINIDVYSDALVVLGTAGIAVPLWRRFGVSPILAYLGMGALLGPLGLGTWKTTFPFLYWFTITDARNVSGIADLGIVFLLFLIGLELSYERLVTMRRLVFGLGTLQVTITTTLIAGFLAHIGLKPSNALIIAACMALSSTAIVLELLANQGRLATSAGRTSFSVLLAQDLAVVPMLMLIAILGAGSGGSIFSSLAVALVQAAAALAIIVLFGRTLLRPLFRLVASAKSSELFIAAILFVIAGSGVVAAQAGLSMALGAFVAGLLLAETEYRKAVEATIAPFKGLLLGVFFFTVGMNIDLRELLRDPVTLIAAVVGLIALKSALLAGLSRLFGLSWPAAIETGLLLGPAGEFALVGIGMATTLGLVAAPLASFAVAVTSMTMVVIPLMSLAAHRLTALIAAPRAADPELSVRPGGAANQALVVGHGRVGRVICALLEQHAVPFIAIDDDAASVSRDRRAGHRVYYGDAKAPDFLKACGLMEASGVIVTIHDPATIDEIVRQVRELKLGIPIISRARDADHARHLYAIGVNDAVPETIEASLQLSEAALVGLGVATGPVIASIHEKRDEFRRALQQAAHGVGQESTRSIRAKRITGA
jgi:monovalent cation:H+ antiporter-2, CPA2 family